MLSPEDPSPPPRKTPRRRLKPLVDAELLKEEVKTLTWVDHVRLYVTKLGLGFGVSLGLHLVVLIGLGFVIFNTRVAKEIDTIVADWLPQGAEKAGSKGRKFREITIPLDLGPATNTKAVNKSASSGSNEKDNANGNGKGTGDGFGVAPVDVRGSLGGRNPRTRASNLERLGATNETERAIKQGLMWLSRQQKSDGHWELHEGYPDTGFKWTKTDTGATGLALMCFLGQGNTHQVGEYAEVVKKGLTWLRATQDPETGDFHDMRREEGREGSFFAHSMATIAICEALALSDDQDLKQSAEKAAKYLLYAQHPDNGGWEYRPITKLMVGDLAVTGWALMALHSARMAGIEIPHEDFVRASAFLDSVKVKGMSRYKFKPNSPDSDATTGLTAEAILCRQWFGWPKSSTEMKDALKYITSADQKPSWGDGRRNVFRWYYTTEVLHNIGGEEWKQWNDAVRTTIVRNQVTSGGGKPGQDVRGSWNPTPSVGDPREFDEKWGRLYVTSMCILILQTPYRHEPIYPEDVANAK